jgi:tight adherence protein B
MDGILVPILVAASVATLAWGLVAAIAGNGRGERKRLQERLAGDGRADPYANGASGRPITLQLQVVGVPDFLAERSVIKAVNRRLLQAYPNRTMGQFLVRAVIIATVVGGVSLLVTASFLVGFLAAAAGAYFPLLLLNMKASARQRMIALQLPEALDFLTRVLRAGHSLSTGLQMMGEELPQPLASEFQKAYDQHSLGVSLEDALRETAQRVESSDFAFFVTAVLVQRQTGGDLSEVLKNISNMIRGRVRLAQHVKAKTAEGRFTGYILVAFPAVMFLLSWYMNPRYAGILIHDSGGRALLAVAVGLQMLGLVAIKKITTVKV